VFCCSNNNYKSRENRKDDYTEIGKTATNLGAENPGSAIGAAEERTPLTVTGTSETPGGIRPILITDHSELLQRLECDVVGKWTANVKNVQLSGIGNTALSMIADDSHKTIGRKFSVVKHDHGLDPKD